MSSTGIEAQSNGGALAVSGVEAASVFRSSDVRYIEEYLDVVTGW